MSLIRQLAMFALGFGVAHKWWSNDFATMAVGLIAAVGPLIWGYWTARTSARIASVAALPEVKKIITDPATASAQPSPKVVPNA